jgi:hypothetical protein
MRRRSGSERRKERRSRQPGQALDVAATLLWTKQRTHAHTHACSNYTHFLDGRSGR